MSLAGVEVRRLVGALWWCAVLGFGVWPAPAGAVEGCAGDCSGDRVVAINELISAVRISLGTMPIAACPSLDGDGNGEASIAELIGAVTHSLDGCGAPPPTPTPSAPPTLTATPANRPPLLGPAAIYRTYPGFPIELPIDAVDPEGGALRFQAAELPSGAVLDPDAGVLRWTPGDGQTGAYVVPVTVSDDGDPVASTGGALLFKVSPLDACTLPTCEPARGCESAVLPLPSPCCPAEPSTRVAEPAAGCPEGRVLFAGRNDHGFGRLQHCDRLQVISFAQGGHTVRFHVEARCVNADEPVTLAARLAIGDAVLFEDAREVTLQRRSDGYAQALALIYPVNDAVPPSQLEGAEAELRVAMTDADGATVTTTLRLVLTLETLGDLPEPDIEDIPAGEAGCIGCHRPLAPDGQRVGIEDAHPLAPLTCTDCHGGNAGASTRAGAHVAPGSAPAFLKNLTSDQLDQVPRDYLRFVNPGDMRVAAQTCGRAGCHPAHAANMPLSTMSTFGGHYTLPRYLAGAQDRAADFGAIDITDPSYDPVTAAIGAVGAFRALREPAPDADRSTIQTAIDVYLSKSCPTCHLAAFGRNDSAGNYRSSGCSACHMVYANDGLSRSADPTLSKDFPPHPVRHHLTLAIPTEQCAHCHFQGGRIGLAYRGIREGGFNAANTPANAVSLGTPLHAHDADYYFTDEDRTNAVDETPPDLHHAAGMVCADCHVGGDVHGDGALYASERHQVGIRCEDCHGTVRAELSTDPVDGTFKTSKGFTLRRVRRDEQNRIRLALLTQDRELIIPQIKHLLDRGANPLMADAMGIDRNGFSHTDRLECYTCHTAWRETCFGCHVTVDDSRSARNNTTGLTSQGAIAVSRDTYSNDFFTLGMDHRGKIAPLCNSMTAFFSYIDAGGTMRYRDRPRSSADGRVGFGWNPFHHHTVSRIPQNCDRCHPLAAELGADNSATLRETYGFGNGAVLLRDGDGRLYDATRFLADDGSLISDFPHPDTGPVPRAIRERALSIPVVPHPR